AGQPRGLGNIDLEDLAMRTGATQDASRQQRRRNQICSVFGPTGYFFRAVDHRHIGADMARRHNLVHGATPTALSSAAYFTASMILTYPVQRQILLPSAKRISSSLGCGLRRSRPAEAMMNPGVQ